MLEWYWWGHQKHESILMLMILQICLMCREEFATQFHIKLKYDNVNVVFITCFHCPQVATKTGTARLRMTKKLNYSAFILKYKKPIVLCNMTHKYLSMGQGWKVYIHEVRITPSSELNLSEGGSLCGVITPNKPKWPTCQNKAWQGWRGDLWEKWVLSDPFTKNV